MCLTAITSRPEPSDQTQVAWKTFWAWSESQPFASRGSLDLLFQFFPFGESKVVPRGTWIQAEHVGLLAKNVCDGEALPNLYPSGFHCFPSEDDAYRYVRHWLPGAVIVKVLIKQLHTIGEQDGLPVLVADWLYVPLEGEALCA